MVFAAAMESERKSVLVYPVTAGQYKLLEEIGYGLGSTVYRALCLLFNEVVAIKTLDLESSNANLVQNSSSYRFLFSILATYVVRVYICLNRETGKDEQ